MGVLWRLLPITMLTVRQAVGGKAVRVVAGLSSVPILFTLIYLINPERPSPRAFVISGIFNGVYLATLLPITVLILATAAFGNELDDRTLPYLTLKPVSRFRIVTEKLLGTMLVGGPIVTVAMTATYLLAFRGDWRESLGLLWALIAASLAGLLGYGAVFQFVSLFITRALLAGITYTLLWESLLARYIPGIRYVSIRHYTASLFFGTLDDAQYTLKNAVGVGDAVVTILVATGIALGLATYRLRRMNLE